MKNVFILKGKKGDIKAERRDDRDEREEQQSTDFPANQGMCITCRDQREVEINTQHTTRFNYIEYITTMYATIFFDIWNN